MVNPVGVSDLYPYQQFLYAFSILAVLIASPGYLKSGHTGVLLLIGWLLATQILLFTNSIIWRGNIRNIPIYCDISSVILAVAALGYEASILCITRQLWRVSKVEEIGRTKAQERRGLIIDLLIGLGGPVLYGVGHGIIQGHRYDVYEDVGCWPTTYNVTLAYPLYYMWPLIVALISAVYGLLTLHNFLKRRKSFETYLSSGTNRANYIRLMWLCCIDLVVCIPFFIYSLVGNATTSTVDPWVSWEVTQSDWYRVDFYRRVLFDFVPSLRIYFITYMVSTCALAFLFFALLAFSQESKRFYVDAYYRLLKPFGVQKSMAPIIQPTRPRKRTWLDKLFRREVLPLGSTRETTESLPQFTLSDSTFMQPAEIPTDKTDDLNWKIGQSFIELHEQLFDIPLAQDTENRTRGLRVDRDDASSSASSYHGQYGYAI